MKLQLLNTKVEKLELFDIEKDDDSGCETSFKYGNAYTETPANTFKVIFEMAIELEEGKQLNITYSSEFEADEIIDDEFKSSPFPTVNAPAIAYPFLRSFIGTMLLNAGYEPILLPSVNFQAIYNEDSE